MRQPYSRKFQTNQGVKYTRGLRLMKKGFRSLGYTLPNKRQLYYNAFVAQARGTTHYYLNLVRKELGRFAMSQEQIYRKIYNYFVKYDGGDYTYYLRKNMDSYDPNTKRYVPGKEKYRLSPDNYKAVAQAIASSIMREIKNWNYGQAFYPTLPYWYEDSKHNEYFFPSLPIINCLYSSQDKESIRHIFARYFSCPPNFGAAYYAAIKQYPKYGQFRTGDQFWLDIPHDSPAYSLYVASDYKYKLPVDLANRILRYIDISDEFNFIVNKHTGNDLREIIDSAKRHPSSSYAETVSMYPQIDLLTDRQKQQYIDGQDIDGFLDRQYSQYGQLPAGYYTPNQILYLVRPYMYSYFQPTIPTYQSFTNYFNLHIGKWPNKDIREVITHFINSQQTEYQDLDKPDADGLPFKIVSVPSKNKPLLGVLNEKEQQVYGSQYDTVPTLFMNDLPGAFIPSRVTDISDINKQFLPQIYSGFKEDQIVQAKPNPTQDTRRLPDAQNF